MAVAAFLLAGCAAEEDLSLAPDPLGDFRLGHNIAIADDTVSGPFSRKFTETQMEAAVQNAVARRLRRYDGDGLYHLGIVVGGVVLAQPGIPGGAAGGRNQENHSRPWKLASQGTQTGDKRVHGGA